MKHIIIGTAGHVDHGKTTLIRALTGHNTDRLKEEQERGISIELGFAPFDLPSGRRAGVVDVPGHERFIRHMLAGVGGFDLVLLVVAADEGVMPQTREHLDILSLLGVKSGLIVLTKVDLVDAEWLELVKEEVRAAVQGTFLAEASMYAVSAVTGQGIPELLAAIDRATDTVTEREHTGPFRLPVDRVFTIAGFGTVVTGTLLSGTVKAGERAEVFPARLATRIRQVEVHGQKAGTAYAGQRVALNLAGLSVEEVERGAVVATPGSLTPSTQVDARLLLLAHAPRPLKQRERIRLHTGTVEVLGRVYLLASDELAPGESTFVQLRLEAPVAVKRGDRFVIRTYSPATTVGGGSILEPAAPRRRRFDPAVLAELAQKEQGDPLDLVAHALERAGLKPQPSEEVALAAGLGPQETAAALKKLVDGERAVSLTLEGSTYYLDRAALVRAVDEATAILTRFHAEHPLRQGLPLEEIRARVFPQLSARLLAEVLRLPPAAHLKVEEERIRLAAHRVSFTPAQAALADGLKAALAAAPYQPPAPLEILERLGAGKEGPEILAALLERGELVQVAEDVVLTRDAFAAAVARVAEHVRARGAITVAELRDLLGTSRRYALPLLEYLDGRRITRRVGDKRILGPAAPPA
ncbi:selenocysteine-specific translation elongation factor [Gelria sp. Kuro-4]|uniref:selenocysteine-specific translation elongation factor n=1 Tax=Gelria sp. Kuro-4 TaxID=2796927 RepID=UPI001BEDA91C|nr:selenocysteine-specific translation elongation factor [Gelria sp. Kuro-4]BCV23822.1 selenocysteine-specific translation elongation factor [Gelria sp. Kuro-4]